MSERQTWDVTIPPEPGPEVTQIRDNEGDHWVRAIGGWHLDKKWAHGDPSDWNVLVRDYGPLIDATGEVVEP